MARGTPLAEVIPRLASGECRQALETWPGAPRFRYQLGRALAAGGDHQAAVAAYREAARMGHRMAHLDLGLAYARGEGVVADAGSAVRELRRAVELGVVAAEKPLSAYVFRADVFTDPDLFQAIYDASWDDIDALDDKRAIVKLAVYLDPFVQIYAQNEGCVLPIPLESRVVLKTLATGGVLIDWVPHEGRETLPLAATVAEANRASDDADTFASHHGCETPVAQKFFGNFEGLTDRIETTLRRKEPQTAPRQPSPPPTAAERAKAQALPEGYGCSDYTALSQGENELLGGRWQADPVSSDPDFAAQHANVMDFEYRPKDVMVRFTDRQFRPTMAWYKSGCGFVWVTFARKPPQRFRILEPDRAELVDLEEPERKLFFNRVPGAWPED